MKMKSWEEIEKEKLAPPVNTENIVRLQDYTQVCVWQGTELGDNTIEEFEAFMLSEFKTRVKFLEIITTKPGDGGPGGRSDMFFAAHKDDVGHFAIPRLSAGIRWIEDVLSDANYRSRIYPSRVFDYMTWDPNSKPSK